MFKLKNFKGSCWVNACLQAVYRIPEVQQRYSSRSFESENIIDACLRKIWVSNGEDGLKDFFEAVKTETMPAGNGIGDTHELFQYLCDKLPFLDKICRFKIANLIQCKSCSFKTMNEDSVIEQSISADKDRLPMAECIMNAVAPYEISDWKCESCKNVGCTKQQLIGSFPKVMVFHRTSIKEASIDYSSILVLNKQTYALLSVSCYNGSHWWGYGRDMPPGTCWYTLDDQSIINHGPKQFPLSSNMRLLIYYRLEN
jgi:hypothetical protein